MELYKPSARSKPSSSWLYLPWFRSGWTQLWGALNQDSPQDPKSLWLSCLPTFLLALWCYIPRAIGSHSQYWVFVHSAQRLTQVTKSIDLYNNNCTFATSLVCQSYRYIDLNIFQKWIHFPISSSYAQVVWNSWIFSVIFMNFFLDISFSIHPNLLWCMSGISCL